MEGMGVPINQALTAYMVVMEVEAAKKQERRISYNDTKEDVKYFKHCDKPEEVLRIAAGLKENERIANIFAVNEFGVTFPKTIAFSGGKFQLVDNEEETK
jgi:hypothetical protein